MLIVNQSIIDMCGSFFALLSAVVEVDGTRMSYEAHVLLVAAAAAVVVDVVVVDVVVVVVVVV